MTQENRGSDVPRRRRIFGRSAIERLRDEVMSSGTDGLDVAASARAFVGFGCPTCHADPCRCGPTDAPATPFWQGYERQPDTVDLLPSALREAMYSHPNQRLGQLIANALGNLDGALVLDEEMARRLSIYSRRHE